MQILHKEYYDGSGKLEKASLSDAKYVSIGCSLKFILTVGGEESIVNVTTTQKVRLDLNS
jgi:hypothetical protein